MYRKKVDKIQKLTVILLLAHAIRALIIVAVLVSSIMYVHDKGIKSIAESVWYGKDPNS